MALEISMTAPTRIGATNTKDVTFDIDGQALLKLPVHLETAGPES
jgi:hypothetical protein